MVYSKQRRIPLMVRSLSELIKKIRSNYEYEIAIISELSFGVLNFYLQI